MTVHFVAESINLDAHPDQMSTDISAKWQLNQRKSTETTLPMGLMLLQRLRTNGDFVRLQIQRKNEKRMRLQGKGNIRRKRGQKLSKRKH